MFKKVICFVFIFLFVAITPFSIYLNLNNNAYCSVDDLILNHSYNKYIIGSLLIASGLVFDSLEDLNEGIQDFITEFNDHESGWQMPGGDNDPKKWADLLLYITSIGVTVYDIGLDKTKQIVDLPQNIIDYFKTYVNLKFNVGNNYLGLQGFQVLTDGSEYYYFPIDEFEIYYYLKINEQLRQYKISSVLTSTYHGINTYKLLQKDDYPFTNSIIYTSANYNIMRLRIFTTDGSVRPETFINGNWDISSYLRPVSYTIVTEKLTPLLQYTVKGEQDVVDNENYNYIHNQTGSPTIVIPDNVTQSDVDKLVGQNYQDIANERTDGIVVPTPTPTPSPEPVPYPNLPGDDTATEEDYDNPNKRALYQRKFPFCLPWDIKAVFMLLKAPAKAPRFEIDVVPGSVKGKIGISGETEFVFDMAEFELVGQVTRFFSFIGFCLTLIFITRNIIKS